MRKTAWDIADEIEEEAKQQYLEEIVHKDFKSQNTAINFEDHLDYTSDDETPSNLQEP